MKGFFLNNISLKLFSVLAAFLIWVAVANEPELTATVDVPVEFRNLRPGLDISSDVPHLVQLQLRGSRLNLGTVTPTTSPVILDAGNMTRATERTFTITSRNLALPQGVTFVRAMPSQIHVSLEQRLEKEVPVRLRLPVALPPGINISSHEISPATIRIAGPAGNVQAVTFVDTDLLDVSALESGKEMRIEATVDDAQLSFVGPSTVRVKVFLTNERQ
jgi:YbbR domain-containing protein